MLWEGVGELEGRDVSERPAEGQEQVAEEKAIEGKCLLVRHQDRSQSQEDRAQDTTDSRPKVVEDRPNRQCRHVRAHRSHGEHEIQVDLDACVNVVHAGEGSSILVLDAAYVLVGALLLEDGLDGCVTEDHTCSKQAVYDGYQYLHCRCRPRQRKWVSHMCTSFQTSTIMTVLTYSLPSGHLKGSYRVQVAWLPRWRVP